jgi:hypothetical protein
MSVFIVIPKIVNHKITQIPTRLFFKKESFTNNFFTFGKNLDGKYSLFSFSTGFLFLKKRKSVVLILWNLVVHYLQF